MLSITTKLPKHTIITDESTGQVYGYHLDPVDIINIIGDPELTKFAKEDGYLVAVDEMGAVMFEEILYQQKWIEKAGIRLHTNMSEDAHYECVLGIMLGPEDIDNMEFKKYYDLDLFNLNTYDQSLTPTAFYDYMIEENNYRDIIMQNIYSIGESSDHTSFGWKLIKNIQHDIVDIDSMLKYHKITPRKLWDKYFHDLYIEDFERLRDLHGVIDLLYTVQEIDSEIPEIVSTFVAHL